MCFSHKNMVYIQHTPCYDFVVPERKIYTRWLKSLELPVPQSAPPSPYKLYNLTNREQKGMIAVTVKVFYLYSAPTGQADNSQAGGNSVALCCI